MPSGVQYVTEQLDRRSLRLLIIGFLARRLGFDSLPIHVKYIAGSSTRKVYFRGTSFFPNQAIPPMFHTYLPRLRNTLQDEKPDKCLGTFKQRNYLSNNVKALVRKIFCHCLLHKSTSLQGQGSIHYTFLCTWCKLQQNLVRHLRIAGKVNQSHYRPEVPRGFQEVKIPRLRDNGPGWW